MRIRRRWLVFTAMLLAPAIYVASYYCAVFAHGIGWMTDLQAQRAANTIYLPIKWTNRRFGKLPGAAWLFYKADEIEHARVRRTGRGP